MNNLPPLVAVVVAVVLLVCLGGDDDRAGSRAHAHTFVGACTAALRCSFEDGPMPIRRPAKGPRRRAKG